MIRRLRMGALWLVLITLTVGGLHHWIHGHTASNPTSTSSGAAAATPSDVREAREQLSKITVKGRAPKTGYSRDEFGGGGWGTLRGCDLRNVILARDLSNPSFRPGTHRCIVERGTLNDPYTGRVIHFVRGNGTSEEVQIDHRVPLMWAWQQGAQQWTPQQRKSLHDDPANLVAVDGSANQAKGASGPGSWLPPSKINRCAYVASFIHVVWRYQLSMNPGDFRAAQAVIDRC